MTRDPRDGIVPRDMVPQRWDRLRPRHRTGSRSGSYRDPDLSDQWLDEAQWRAQREFRGDAAKIILRLVKEVRTINRRYSR